MTTDIYQLIGAYAVDALDENERKQVEEFQAQHPEYAAEAAELRAAAQELTALSATTPPPSLRASILDEVHRTRPLAPEGPAVEPAAEATQTPVTDEADPVDTPADELSTRRARRTSGGVSRRWLLGAAAAAVIGTGVGVWSPWDSPSASQVAISQITDAPDAKDYTMRVGGRAVTITRSTGHRRAVMHAAAMENPPSGKVYQMWLQHSDGSMSPAGLVPPATSGPVTMLLSGDATQAVGVGMTMEPAGGSPRPTSEPMGVVEF